MAALFGVLGASQLAVALTVNGSSVVAKIIFALNIHTGLLCTYVCQYLCMLSMLWTSPSAVLHHHD